MPLLASLQAWARRLRRDALTLWFAWRDPRTPLPVKGLCLFVAAYTFSPIDLIPDFVPILGYLDDLVLLPALIWLAVRLMPADVLEASRLRADAWIAERGGKPRSYLGAAVVLVVWAAVGYTAWSWYATGAVLPGAAG